MTEITDKEMQETLSRSGYLLEARIDDVLTQHGYAVDANIGYPDPAEGKTRELDARAMNGSILVKDSEPLHLVWTTLLIECWNNAQPVVLLTKERPVPMIQDDVPCIGVPLTVEMDTLQSFLKLQDFHHYCDSHVATQFCSFQQKKGDKKGEWMASQEEALWSPIKKLGDALQHDARELESTWYWGGDEDEPINLTLYYCALVLQGRLVEVDARSPKATPREIRRGLLRRKLSWHGWNQKTQDYFIDVVTENEFPAYLGVLERERAEFKRRAVEALADLQREANAARDEKKRKPRQ